MGDKFKNNEFGNDELKYLEKLDKEFSIPDNYDEECIFLKNMKQLINKFLEEEKQFYIDVEENFGVDDNIYIDDIYFEPSINFSFDPVNYEFKNEDDVYPIDDCNGIYGGCIEQINPDFNFEDNFNNLEDKYCDKFYCGKNFSNSFGHVFEVDFNFDKSELKFNKHIQNLINQHDDEKLFNEDFEKSIEEELFFNNLEKKYDMDFDDFYEPYDDFSMDFVFDYELQKEDDDVFPIDDCNGIYGGCIEQITPDFNFNENSFEHMYFEDDYFNDVDDDYYDSCYKEDLYSSYESYLVNHFYNYDICFYEEDYFNFDESEFELNNNVQNLINQCIDDENSFNEEFEKEAEFFINYDKEYEKYIEKLLD